MNKLAVCLTSQHHQDLKALLEHRGKPALSLYLPRSDADSADFLLRQALHEVEAQLEEYELHPFESQALSAPLRKLREDPAFVRQAAEGLALYVAEDRLYYYFAAMTGERRVVVDDYFYLIPLIAHHLGQRGFHPLQREQEAALLHYQTLRDTPKALQDIVSVAQAAYNSRVEKLFLVVAHHYALPKRSGNGHAHHDGQDGKGQSAQHRRMDELLNRAAIYTYLNGGEVYTVSPDQLADAEQAAAILRY